MWLASRSMGRGSLFGLYLPLGRWREDAALLTPSPLAAAGRALASAVPERISDGNHTNSDRLSPPGGTAPLAAAVTVVVDRMRAAPPSSTDRSTAVQLTEESTTTPLADVMPPEPARGARPAVLIGEVRFVFTLGCLGLCLICCVKCLLSLAHFIAGVGACS